MTLDRCFEEDQAAVKALLTKFAEINPGLEIQETRKKGLGWRWQEVSSF
jgi:hypothetical protein